MRATLLLCLVLTFLPQTKTEPTVALIFREPERVEIVTESAARAEYQQLSAAKILTAAEFARLVALELSLGTTQDIDRISLPRNNTREFLDNEIRRGVRKPLQGGEQ